MRKPHLPATDSHTSPPPLHPFLSRPISTVKISKPPCEFHHMTTNRYLEHCSPYQNINTHSRALITHEWRSHFTLSPKHIAKILDHYQWPFLCVGITDSYSQIAQVFLKDRFHADASVMIYHLKNDAWLTLSTYSPASIWRALFENVLTVIPK